MKKVLELTGMEYRKILRRKSTWIGVAFLLLAASANPLFSIFESTYYEGEMIATHSEWSKLRREETDRIAGVVDAAFLEAASRSVLDYYGQREEHEKDADWYRDAYAHLMLPYDIFFYVMPRSAEWAGADVDSYYLQYEDTIRSAYDSELTGQDMEDFLEMSRGNWPFTYGWMDAYRLFCNNQCIIGILCCLVVSFCLAGMFAGESAVRMDALILSARYGKNQVLLAKLLCGISFAAITGSLASLFHFLVTGMSYGFEGAGLTAQMYFPHCAWNLTLGQLAWIVAGCTVIAVMLIGCLAMAISAYAKTPVPVLVVIVIFLFVPTFLALPEGWHVANVIYHLFPTNLLYGGGDFRYIFRIGDAFVTGWQYAYPAYFLACAILIAVAYRGYKYRQVGG